MGVVNQDNCCSNSARGTSEGLCDIIEAIKEIKKGLQELCIGKRDIMDGIHDVEESLCDFREGLNELEKCERDIEKGLKDIEDGLCDILKEKVRL